jgi:uncharacterized protein DUF3306
MAEEKFLARWSRRKRATERQVASPAATSSRGEISQDASNAVAKAAPAPNSSQSLPAIEAIDANTDIREFLAEGVPSGLARAALRRAWASDPAIRDFVGLAENAWDFNAPASIPGFGTVSAEEVRRLLASAEESGSARAEVPPPAAPAPKPSSQEAANEGRTPAGEQGTDENRSVAGPSETPETTENTPCPPSVSRHGGALPK